MWPRRSSTSCRTRGAEDFGVLSANGARKPAFRALARVLPLRRGRAQPGDARAAPARRERRRERLGARSATSCCSKPSRARRCATARCSRSTASTATRSRCRRVLGTHGLRVRVFQYGTGPAHDAQKTHLSAVLRRRLARRARPTVVVTPRCGTARGPSARGSSGPAPATSGRCSSCPTPRARPARSGRAGRGPGPSR